MTMKLDVPESSTATTWWVEIFLDESDGESRASARLHTHTRPGVTGVGSARVSPEDEDVPEIGYELATARALRHLSDQLLEGAAADIAGATHEDVTAEELDHPGPGD